MLLSGKALGTMGGGLAKSWRGVKMSRTQIGSAQERSLGGRDDSEEVSAVGLDRTFLGDGKTCLDIWMQRRGERRRDRKLGTRLERTLCAT